MPKKPGIDTPAKMRPDVAETAYRTRLEATGQAKRTLPPTTRPKAAKNIEAVAKGSKGGLIGGKARAAKLSGFLPHERAWFQGLFDAGWTDVVRRDYGERKGPYTWWSNFGRAKAEDRGWRLDHVLANRAAAPFVRLVGVDREAGIACSDHAPVVVELTGPP